MSLLELLFGIDCERYVFNSSFTNDYVQFRVCEEEIKSVSVSRNQYSPIWITLRENPEGELYKTLHHSARGTFPAGRTELSSRDREIYYEIKNYFLDD